MKYFSTFLLCSLCSLCSVVMGAEAITNQLSIHLLAESIPRESLRDGTVQAPAVKAVSEAILSDADFVAYDITNRCFEITAEVARRLSLKLNGPTALVTLRSGERVYSLERSEIPFLLMASGEPVYVGVFSSFVSSSCFLVPALKPGVFFVNADSTNSVEFVITLLGKHQVAGTDVGGGTDVRDDPRIIAAVKKLGLSAVGRVAK